jgi:hypothetical protein
MYTPTATGTFNQNGQDVVGTLYESTTGAWQVVTPRGQIQMSGSAASDLPTLKGKNTIKQDPLTTFNMQAGSPPAQAGG